ncbi:helix-turn-helix domain protein [Shewanella baltica OS625]|uniref:helix-turn-helix domain-containing protein n=1 Tax=Shewanella baltica TaxID=62322 RepID=UPI000230DF02|nr:helix-turn-helix transcriptional regulator [Shewanella baltica]EHC04188.1 helix-turn-helix domain protein [Shewanella baltica OS625]
MSNIKQPITRETFEKIAEVAAKMGVAPSTVSKLENHADRASIVTLERYASACGASLQISIQR